MLDIRKIREQACMSRDDFAKAIGVVPLCIYNWEAGNRSPNWISKRKIKKFCEDNGIAYEP